MRRARLASLRELKTRHSGERVAFRAQVLRTWEVGGMRMALVGDESALVRVEIGDAMLNEMQSYEFRDAVVKTYPGGWHSLSLPAGDAIVPLDENVTISQSNEYVERTYKILAGVQRKKGRAAGLLPPWRHPVVEE